MRRGALLDTYDLGALGHRRGRAAGGHRAARWHLAVVRRLGADADRTHRAAVRGRTSGWHRRDGPVSRRPRLARTIVPAEPRSSSTTPPDPTSAGPSSVGRRRRRGSRRTTCRASREHVCWSWATLATRPIGRRPPPARRPDVRTRPDLGPIRRSRGRAHHPTGEPRFASGAAGRALPCVGAGRRGADGHRRGAAADRRGPLRLDPLRQASWVVNGYLLAYIAAMPLAGRAADRFGLPPLLLGSLGIFAVGLAAGGRRRLARPAHRRAGHPGLWRWRRSCRSPRPAPASCSRARPCPGPGRGERGQLPGHGARALPGCHGPGALRPGRRPSPVPVTPTPPCTRCWCRRGAGCSTSVHPRRSIALVWCWAALAGWERRHASGSHRRPGCGARDHGPGRGPGLSQHHRRARCPGRACQCRSSPALSASRPPRGRSSTRAARTTRSSTRACSATGCSGVRSLVSLLTGYALATAIVGCGRVGRPRPLRRPIRAAGGPGVAGPRHGHRRHRLGLPAEGHPGRAPGHRRAGHRDRRHGACWAPRTSTPSWPCCWLALVLFGLGFGITVTPRSTAALESLGRASFGIASAGVTVARMAGMAIGLAVLTGFGTQRIEGLSVVLTDAAARDLVLPVDLRGRAAGRPARGRRARVVGFGAGGVDPRGPVPGRGGGAGARHLADPAHARRTGRHGTCHHPRR